jgi:CubicO group peptidase (beta-lactamase class C family)
MLTVTRHLLTHSSGMAYVFMHPLLARYQGIQGEQPLIQQSIVSRLILTASKAANPVLQKDSFHQFLLFEPGERWMYSPGVDWAGVAVGSKHPYKAKVRVLTI